MLAIFRKQVAAAPEELNSPRAGSATKPPPPSCSRNPEEILRDFHAAHPDERVFSTTFFAGGAALACVSGGDRVRRRQRTFCCLDGVFCVFRGRLDNLSSLIRRYGLCPKSTDEALLVVEAYRTLRDRGPYPADQVLMDLVGPFAFVLFDHHDNNSNSNGGTVFAALGGSDEDTVPPPPLFWGVAADGSTVICDDRELVKRGCGRSYAPFPAGCMFHHSGANGGAGGGGGGGLRSFEHPMNRLKAVPRVDSEGVMCGATFKVDDAGAKISSSLPRVGSAANWASAWEWDDATTI